MGSPAQPSPGAQAAANSALGKQLPPPTLVLPLALPGAADCRAQGEREKIEGEREGGFRKERERRYGAPGEVLGKGRNTSEEHQTWHIPELKYAKKIIE